MKTLGLSLIAVVLTGTSLLQGQSKKDVIGTLANPDSQTLHSQAPRANLLDGAKIDSNSLLALDDDRDNTCAFMRTYRMKREARGSDVTRPAGYTVCVPTRRFEMKSTVEVIQEPAD